MAALEAFADEARAIKVRAEAIRARGNAFLNGVVAHGIDKKVFHASANDKADTVRTEHLSWDQDDAAVAENNAILAEIEQLANDLEAAEATCANAITAAVGAEPVAGPGTSIDWTKVPAGTPTPWGTELSQRSETDAEAQVRGFYERPIAMVNFALALAGVSNKTLNSDDINHMTFDPTAFDFSLTLRAQTEQAVLQSGAGLLVLSSPVLGSLTLANLRSKNWFGSFSRATSGTVVKGGAAYLDQWKSDPQAARGGLVFDALTLLVPGGPEVLLPAKAGARVAEDVAGAGLRSGVTDTSRVGAKVEAGRNGLPHMPGSGLEARRGLGHAEVPDGVNNRLGAATKKLTADDLTLDSAPDQSKAPGPRTPPHVPEPVKGPEREQVPVSAEHRAPRVHEQVDEPKVREHERVPEQTKEKAPDERQSDAPVVEGTDHPTREQSGSEHPVGDGEPERASHPGDATSESHPTGHPAGHDGAGAEAEPRSQYEPHKLTPVWHEMSAHNVLEHQKAIDRSMLANEEVPKAQAEFDRVTAQMGVRPEDFRSKTMEKSLRTLREAATTREERARVSELRAVSEELVRAHVERRDAGEAVGMSAVRDLMESSKGDVISGLEEGPGVQGTFDGLSWHEFDHALDVWEGKADKAELGSRKVDGVVAHQGSPVYLNEIIKRDPHLREYLRGHPDHAHELETKQAAVRYTLVRGLRDGRVEATRFDVRADELDLRLFSADSVSPAN